MADIFFLQANTLWSTNLVSAMRCKNILMLAAIDPTRLWVLFASLVRVLETLLGRMVTCNRAKANDKANMVAAAPGAGNGDEAMWS